MCGDGAMPEEVSHVLIHTCGGLDSCQMLIYICLAHNVTDYGVWRSFSIGTTSGKSQKMVRKWTGTKSVLCMPKASGRRF